jgi:Fur family ferric uptake transcriptional regulator
MSTAKTPRATRQRTAVIAILETTPEFMSAQQIHGLLRDRDENVGLTTVYRALQAMSDTDEIDSLRRDDGEIVYRSCGTDHHHHMTCRACHSTVELLAPDVEQWARSVALAHGFTDVNHTIELVGLCAACSQAAAITGG